METTEIKPEIILKAIGEGGGTGMLRYDLGIDSNGKQCYKFTNCSKDSSTQFEAFSFTDAFKMWENALASFLEGDVMLNWFYRFVPSEVHQDYIDFIANDLRSRLIKSPHQKPIILGHWARYLGVSVDFLLGSTGSE